MAVIVPDKGGISIRNISYGDVTQVETHDAVIVIGKNSRNELVYIEIIYLEKEDPN